MKKTQRVSIEDLTLAASWLECFDGIGGENEAVRRVADYLRSEVDRREAKSAERTLQRRYPSATRGQIRRAIQQTKDAS